MVYTLAFRLLRNREDAEEVSQDVFIKAYRGLASFRGSAAFSTWLYKIAYRSSLDFLKKYHKKSDPAIIRMNEGYPLPAMDEGMQPMEEDEQKTMVRKAITSLSGEDQVLITLYYYDERSLKEIAGILEISVNTAKVRLFRCRDRLMRLVRNPKEGQTIK